LTLSIAVLNSSPLLLSNGDNEQYDMSVVYLL